MIPEYKEVAGAVHHLCLNTAVRPSGIKAEHIWAWLRASNRKDLPYPLKWDMDIGLIQAAFREGDLAEECAWKTVVPIPKGNGNFRGIGLVDILWKTVTGILNCHLTAEIQFYDILQGFCTGRGTRTTSLEVKLLQQIMALREEVMY